MEVRKKLLASGVQCWAKWATGCPGGTVSRELIQQGDLTSLSR